MLVDNITIESEVIEQAKQNQLDAIHAIGCEYARINNREKAVKWLEASSIMGFYASCHELKRLRAETDNPPTQDELERYAREVKNHVRLVFLSLAKTKFEQKNYQKAKDYYQEAAVRGDVDAQFSLGLCYYNRWGLCPETWDLSANSTLYNSIRIDYQLAMLWFLRSSIQGHSEASCYIGYIYENGYGVSKDNHEAFEWYRKSKAGGYQAADEHIKRLNEQGWTNRTKG